MVKFPQSCNSKKEFLLIAAAALLSVIAMIHIEKLVHAIAPPPSISPTMQHDERNATRPVFQARRANHCPHWIDSMDAHGPDKEWHSGGWAVRQLCSQPLDTLFFVHVAPSYWKRRIHLRTTLFEEASQAAFNWTGVFFVAQDRNPLVNLWTKLEAEVAGDVVVFPYNDTYFTTVYKFVRGMRWVAEYCPRVRNIVKIDHDVSVQPFELRRYLDRNLPLKDSSIHCNMVINTAVFRDGRDPHCVPDDQLAMDTYPHYCSGMSMIMTTDTMRKLYRASKFVKSYQIDDAYVSGHLAQLANVGHEHMGRKVILHAWDVNKQRMLNRVAIFTHERSAYGNSVGWRALWELMIWREITEALDRRAFNSSNRLVDQMYRRVFNETRRVLRRMNVRRVPHQGAVKFIAAPPIPTRPMRATDFALVTPLRQLEGAAVPFAPSGRKPTMRRLQSPPRNCFSHFQITSHVSSAKSVKKNKNA
ncbi:hypothetical protein HPB51_024088 [Rhipicephalus microplus]|uniref:Hexosyltransferase n=1 Tax=Rhipicephalus microplus TaxID=6941 RepID=A0A9J6EDJ9_RHIMP|nr:hypothetical protein HPB51_024088 [Rhipicephalus microplus]